MKPWFLFVAVMLASGCGGLLVQQQFAKRARDAEVEEALKPLREMTEQHERELAEFARSETERLEREKAERQRRIQPVMDRLDLAKKLYQDDVALVGKEEANRRQALGLYLKVAFER